VASWDWIMSLEPEWFSTMFAAYNFAGVFVCTLATITITAILLRRQGPLKGVVREHHLHDLGKLIFAFTVFWAYIGFSQYFLIWYANIPEETKWYLFRNVGFITPYPHAVSFSAQHFRQCRPPAPGSDHGRSAHAHTSLPGPRLTLPAETAGRPEPRATRGSRPANRRPQFVRCVHQTSAASGRLAQKTKSNP
jgi:hypothetical protein